MNLAAWQWNTDPEWVVTSTGQRQKVERGDVLYGFEVEDGVIVLWVVHKREIH